MPKKTHDRTSEEIYQTIISIFVFDPNHQVSVSVFFCFFFRRTVQKWFVKWSRFRSLEERNDSLIRKHFSLFSLSSPWNLLVGKTGCAGVKLKKIFRKTFSMNLQQAVALLFISTFLYVTVLIFQPGILSALPNILSWSYSEYIDDPYGDSARRNLALNISENTGTLLNFKDMGGNKAKVLLLVIVSTAPQRFARRQAIRDTWWKHCAGDQVKLQKTGNKNAKLFFYIAAKRDE